MFSLDQFSDFLFEKAAIGIAIVEKDDTISRVNRAFEGVSGYSREELEGQVVYTDLFPDRETDPLAQMRQEPPDDVTYPVGTVTHLRRKDGAELEVCVSISPFPDTGRFAVLLLDVGESVRVWRKQIARNALTTMRQVVAGFACDLNNPVTCVVGHSELVQGKGEDEGTKEDLQQILKHARRTGQIIEEMLGYTRGPRLARTCVNINVLVGEAARCLDSTLAGERVRVEFDVAPSLPRTMVDHDRLLSALSRLIIHAVLAMADNTGPRILTLRTSLCSMKADADDAVTDFICIDVEDTGPGIPPSVMERLFEPFFTTGNRVGEAGVGLIVQQEIIEAHGGSIEVQTRWGPPVGDSGTGTTFSVYLPVVEPDEGEG